MSEQLKEKSTVFHSIQMNNAFTIYTRQSNNNIILHLYRDNLIQ